MLIDRVTALRQANIFEPHRYRHIVGPIRIEQIDATVAQVRSNFIAVRIMHDGEMGLFAAGRYLDRIASDEPALPLHRTPRRPRQPEDRHIAGDPALGLKVS